MADVALGDGQRETRTKERYKIYGQYNPPFPTLTLKSHSRLVAAQAIVAGAEICPEIAHLQVPDRQIHRPRVRVQQVLRHLVLFAVVQFRAYAVLKGVTREGKRQGQR